MPQAKAARQNSIGRPPIARILWIQLLCVVMLASGFLLKGPVSAGSALAGGLIFLVPHAYFAYKAFAHTGAREARRAVHALYTGEAVKLSMTAVLFAAVFMLMEPIDKVALFATYILMLVVNGCAGLIIRVVSGNNRV